MRKLALKNFWGSPVCGEICGNEYIKDFGNPEAELHALRNSVAVCDMSFVKKFVLDEPEGLDFLDSLLAANILKLRYGRMLDTFLADDGGNIVAEVFAASIDDKIIVTAETLSPDAADVIKSGANCKDISDEYVFISADGPSAWKVAKAIFGADIFNLPYLSVEKYQFDDKDVFLMRNGKTGEFGYQFLAPLPVAEKLASSIMEAAKSEGGAPCGFDAHQFARLEGNFFNTYAEGNSIKNPLELGLQWMMDFSKESFLGSDKLFAERKNGVKRKITAVKSEKPLDCGTKIFDSATQVGEICVSKTCGKKHLELALFDSKYALPGFEFSTSPGGVCDVKTVSRPFILAQSLIRGMEQQ